MIGLTSLEVYISVFDITEDYNKFELYIFPEAKSGGISYEKVGDEIERDLEITGITATDLQDDIIGPIIVEENRKEVSKRLENGGYIIILAGYHSTVFQDFESYFRTEIDLVEDDIRLVLDKYNSSFITYELQPRIYFFKDLSEFVFNILHADYPASSHVIVIEFDDISMKTKLVVGDGIIAIRFDEKSFFSTVLGFTPGWDFKHYNEYFSQKIINLSTRNKIHLKCDVIDGFIQDGIRRPILISFVLD